MPITLEDALLLVTTDPRTLLDNAYISLAGGGPHSISKISYFSISKPLGLQNMYQRAGNYVPGFQIMVYESDVPLPAEFTTAGEDHLSFQAYYIAMKRMAAIAGYAPAGTRYALPSVGGPDICITSQLSGCTFGIGSQAPGGSCLVSHIQPTGVLAAAQPVMAAQTQDLFGAAPQKLVQKGAALDYADRANVMGQRNYGHWDFFMQAFAAGFVRMIEPVQDL